MKIAIMVFHFVYKKYFWYFLVNFIIYTAYLSSSWSNEKQFQLVDLVIGRLWYSYFGL